FLFATNDISSSTRGLVHEVIPYIDVLTAHLDDFQDNLSLTSAILAAAKRGRLMLSKYYSLTDETPIFRIAMIMHPAYKLSYFRKADWPEASIQEACRLITHEWTTRYKPAPAANLTGPAVGPSTGEGTTRSWSCTVQITRSVLADRDALEAYLEAPPLATVKDPLAYQNTAIKSGSEDPALAHMALNFLSIPATSVDAERAFSRGRLMVNRLRTSLSDKSVRAGTVLASWARVDGLVNKSKAVAFLGDKRGA
ncbi:hypothetical protein DICSQDRAFT_74416, partial [Dichomitus squalens LYAD-421 SS1]